MKNLSSQFQSALIERTKDILDNAVGDYPGKKIDQVKTVRTVTHFTLLDAKRIVDERNSPDFRQNSLVYENLISNALNNIFILNGWGKKPCEEEIQIKNQTYMVIFNSENGSNNVVKEACVVETLTDAQTFKNFICRDPKYWNVQVGTFCEVE